MIASIISVPVDDGVGFRVKRISEIMERPSIRASASVWKRSLTV